MILRLKSKISDVKELLAACGSFSKQCGCELQVFDTASVGSERHLEQCRLLAERTFAEKREIANSLKNEMLLFVAATMKIDEAIRRAGVKDTNDFVVFCLGKCVKRDKAGLLAALQATELEFKPKADELRHIERSALSKIRD